MSPTRSRGDWKLLVIFFGIIAVLSIAFYLAINWADDQSPWFLRVVVVFVATMFGYRIGHAMGNEKTRPKWLPFGVAVAAAAIAIHFGAVRPAIRDHKRDKAFESLFADGVRTQNALETVAADIPDPNRQDPIAPEHRDRNIQSLEMGISWLKRFPEEFDGFTPDQRDKIKEVFQRIVAASASARETMAVIARDDAYILLLIDGRAILADLEKFIKDTPETVKKEQIAIEQRVQIVLALERTAAWTKRYQEQGGKLTSEQRAKLDELSPLIEDASKTVRERLAKLALRPKK